VAADEFKTTRHPATDNTAKRATIEREIEKKRLQVNI
jgi:hypothetical protein